DLRGILGQAAPAAGPPEALDQARLVERAELLFEEPNRDLLRLRDLACGHEGPALLAHRQLDHRPHGVLELLRDLQHVPLIRCSSLPINWAHPLRLSLW